MERIALIITPGSGELMLASALQQALKTHGLVVVMTPSVESATVVVRESSAVVLVIFTTARGVTRPTLQGIRQLYAGNPGLRTVLLTAVCGATDEALAEVVVCAQLELLDAILIKPDVILPLRALVGEWFTADLPSLKPTGVV